MKKMWLLTGICLGVLLTLSIPKIMAHSEDQITLTLAKMQSEIDELKKRHNHAYVYSGMGYKVNQSTSWVKLNELSCTINTTGRSLKITMDFGARGDVHGGIRLRRNGNIVGSDARHGLAWVIPDHNVKGKWVKICIIRVLDNIPAGRHHFIVEIKSQPSTSANPQSELEIMGGQDNVSGFHLLIEEL